MKRLVSHHTDRTDRSALTVGMSINGLTGRCPLIEDTYANSRAPARPAGYRCTGTEAGLKAFIEYAAVPQAHTMPYSTVDTSSYLAFSQPANVEYRTSLATVYATFHHNVFSEDEESVRHN